MQKNEQRPEHRNKARDCTAPQTTGVGVAGPKLEHRTLKPTTSLYKCCAMLRTWTAREKTANKITKGATGTVREGGTRKLEKGV